MIDALSTALGGLQAQSQRLGVSANNIASGNADLVRESVNILESKTLFKANLSVIKTEKDILGSLLDIIT